MASHNELGRFGEAHAVAYLKQNGYQILETNWRYLKAEIDIIAKQDQWICIIEVKTRSSTDFGRPEAFVHYKKQQLLIAAAHQYIVKNNIDAEVRFDIISVIIQTKCIDLEHLVGAFTSF